MPKFKVIIHRRVYKFIQKIKDEKLKNKIKDIIVRLEDYPLVLREIDVEKIRGLEKTFRMRIGKYRVIFFVDKTERTIYVTNIGARRRVYKKLE